MIQIDHGAFIELKAEENKIIISKSTYFDEELGQEVPEIKSEQIFLGIYDSPENYYEIEQTEV